ncbi:MAG TPA: hypothetical protein VEU97_13985 [Ktedonobacteraceae bacterium]|nr:hypothetical protein [Ktedonobacteraceae bacterium]
MSLIHNDLLQRRLLFLVVVEMRMIWLKNTLQKVLVLSVIVFANIVVRVESVRRRKALEPTRERYASGLALVRYVQLHRQCSEVASYQRLATFVKKHVPVDGSCSIECMEAYDHNKQRLLERAQNLLVQDPDAIDKI